MSGAHRHTIALIATLTVLGVSTRDALAQDARTDKCGPPMTADHAAMDHTAMDHTAHLAQLRACTPGETAGATPTMAGQAAFAAIGEIVRLLKADPATDWSKVNLEALRLHLADMDLVALRSIVVQRAVPGGVEASVTGDASTVAAIRRMLPNQAHMLDADPAYTARASEIAGGVQLTVTAKNPSDAGIVARIRGLGFAGLLTEGDHHPRHHLALARGDASPHAH